MAVRSLRLDPIVVLLSFGILAFLLATLSVADMFLPRPYDGVMLESDAPGRLVVRSVVPGSGAQRAGIAPGDRIVGIDREILRSPIHAAKQLNRFRIGAVVPYFLERRGRYAEVPVELGPRRIGDRTYLIACVLGACFFLVGLFVVLRQPRMRPAQVFFLMSTLFMVFLICRLRPASYSWVDSVVLSTGTVALLFLPATFLHFFVMFPRSVWARVRDAGWSPGRRAIGAATVGMYALPPAVLVADLARHRGHMEEVALISGAPRPNWWVLAAYIMVGLAILASNAGARRDPRERRGVLLVLAGSLFGLVPFLVVTVAFPDLLHSERFLYLGLAPLLLVPLTFAYAIVRFQLLDIKVILRKSLLYTLTTALITGLYAAAIAAFDWLFRGTVWAESRYSPIVLALAILLLFEPLRRRLQVLSDRFFLAERARLQQAAIKVGEAFVNQEDVGAVVRHLVADLPRLLGLRFAALYLEREDSLVREAGPESLPRRLPVLPELHEELARAGGLSPIERLGRVQLRSRDAAGVLHRLQRAGVETLGSLSSRRRRVGLLLLSERSEQMRLGEAEVELLRGLLNQASMALETQRLLEDRTRQAELERELEIAAAIQASLQPRNLRLAPGWRVAATCRPARQVGGDFIAELPGQVEGTSALAYGDVSGKSVSGALVMMAAYEILNSLAMTARDPEELLRLANRRLYDLRSGGFVALGYLTPDFEEGSLRYLVAGQPQPLLRTVSGEVRELPLPGHRIPLGALAQEEYHLMRVAVQPGELVLGYSDGVMEACSPDGEFFGAQRLASVLAAAPPEPQQVVEQVMVAVETFTRGQEPYDDLTLVALGRQPEESR